MSPRVLHVIAALVGGGAETQVKMLMRGLDARGWNVGVTYLKDDPAFVDRGGISYIPIHRGRRLDLIGIGRQVAAAIDSFRPDIVHTWLPEIVTLPAALHARKLGIPCISSQRRSFRHSPSTTIRLRDSLTPLTHLLATQVVCNFPWDREPWLVKRAIQMRNGTLIRNGLEVRPAELYAKPDWLRDGTFKILYVGRLIEQKRVDILLEAVAHLREQGHKLQLGIYGQGHLSAALKDLAEARRLKEGKDVRFLGYQPQWQSAARYYDLFALPTFAEGMPNVLVEAMAAGLPVIASDIPEIASFVRHGKDAWLVEPGDVNGFVAGLRWLIGDSTIRSELVSNGRRLASDLSPDRMVDAYEALYNDLLFPSRS